MWQRFTERARKAVFFAQEEAQKFGEGYVSTEHLLLGLVRDEDSVAARVLVGLNLTLEGIREEVLKRLPRAQGETTPEMTLTPRAKKVIDLAYDEARELDNDYIGTEHLLMGLLREREGLAGRVLAGMGVEVEAARSAIRSLQQSKEANAEIPQRPDEKHRSLSALERAIVRLVWSLAAGDPASVREATRDLRAAGARRTQVTELWQLVAQMSSSDISHLGAVCEEVMDEGSD